MPAAPRIVTKEVIAIPNCDIAESTTNILQEITVKLERKETKLSSVLLLTRTLLTRFPRRLVIQKPTIIIITLKTRLMAISDTLCTKSSYLYPKIDPPLLLILPTVKI